MRTKAHWELCKELASYHAASRLGLQLKEVASKQGYHPNGIKILSKEDVDLSGRIADAQVRWNEGPINWAMGIELMSIPGVWAEVEDPYTVSFYEM